MKSRIPPLLGLVAVVAACADAPSPGRRGAAASAIVNGAPSGEGGDSTVLVMHYDALAKGGGAASGCTGSLLAPRLVLTARHCVALTDEGAACDASGKAISGGGVERDFDPTKIYVFAGRERPDFIGGTARPVRGKEILSTGATTLCGNDIALVILAEDLPGGVIAPVRLAGGPNENELVTVVGWGISEKENNPPVRLERVGVKILDVGPTDGLSPSEFRTTEGACAGDSGGPAIAGTGAVIGALSRGGNGKKGGGPEACIGGATNIFTSTAGHADLLRAGYEKVGQAPWLEGEESPLLPGATPDPAAITAVAEPEDEGCTMAAPSPRPRADARAGGALALFAAIVLLACLRRRNPARSRV